MKEDFKLLPVLTVELPSLTVRKEIAEELVVKAAIEHLGDLDGVRARIIVTYFSGGVATFIYFASKEDVFAEGDVKNLINVADAERDNPNYKKIIEKSKQAFFAYFMNF